MFGVLLDDLPFFYLILVVCVFFKNIGSHFKIAILTLKLEFLVLVLYTSRLNFWT
jgi:hypothetical protein